MQSETGRSGTLPGATLLLSVVAPAHDEERTVGPLVEPVEAALEPLRIGYEIVIVDDGSGDATPSVLRRLVREHPRLRVLHMCNTPPGRGHGQSAAFLAAFQASRGSLIAVLDADLQNDPVDIPALLRHLQESGADMIQGDRSRNRRDTRVRRLSSRVGRFFRRALLGDTIRDTGCSLRLMRREVALSLPLEFAGLHRFVPLMARQMGFRVREVPVHHRERATGRSKYGVWDRALPGLVDCLAVRWMAKRRRPLAFAEVVREPARLDSADRADRVA